MTDEVHDREDRAQGCDRGKHRDHARGAAAGAAQAGCDPTGRAERGHEIPENREPRGGKAGEVATGRDQRVDQRVTAQTASVTTADPVHERRRDERRSTDYENCVGDEPASRSGHGDVATPAVPVVPVAGAEVAVTDCEFLPVHVTVLCVTVHDEIPVPPLRVAGIAGIVTEVPPEHEVVLP